MQLQAAIGQALEQGRWQGPIARATAAAFGPLVARAVVRRLTLPAGARVIAVGGATLGGSGKTPLAVACARELAAMGARVALVGHAYRARPGVARRVFPDDPAAQVGDEALVAARELGPAVPVVVAPKRAGAIEHAARLAQILVLDGVLQTAPERVALALLAVDDDEPWGHAGAVPPRGDLQAPVDALRAAADEVVTIGGPASDARVTSCGAWVGDRLVAWEEMRGRRLGLMCALGRPERVLRFLARRGIVPVAVVRGADHGPIPGDLLLRARRDVDVWLTTTKCALHAPALPDLPLCFATIDYALVLSAHVRRSLAHAARLDPAVVQQ